MIQMFNGQFSREGWKTVRVALTTWGKTARFVIIILAIATPPILVATLVRLAI